MPRPRLPSLPTPSPRQAAPLVSALLAVVLASVVLTTAKEGRRVGVRAA
jgi:hypothetical protein